MVSITEDLAKSRLRSNSTPFAHSRKGTVLTIPEIAKFLLYGLVTRVRVLYRKGLVNATP